MFDIETPLTSQLKGRENPQDKAQKELQFVIYSCKHALLNDNLTRNFLLILAENLLKIYSPLKQDKANVNLSQEQQKFDIKQDKTKEQVVSVCISSLKENYIGYHQNQELLHKPQKELTLKEQIQEAFRKRNKQNYKQQYLKTEIKIQPPCEPLTFYNPVQPFQILSPLEWLDQKCYYYGQILKTEFSAVSKKFSILFTKMQVSVNKESKFRIMVNSNSSGAICIGLIDKNHRQKQYMPSGCISAHYRGDGVCWDGVNIEQDRGIGFRNGQIVELIVNRLHGRVEWQVGGATRCEINSNKIKDVNTMLVPYIITGNFRDTITMIV